MESLPGFYRELMFSRFLYSQINVCHEFYIEMLAYSMTVTKSHLLVIRVSPFHLQPSVGLKRSRLVWEW